MAESVRDVRRADDASSLDNVLELPNLVTGKLADLIAAASAPGSRRELRGELAARSAFRSEVAFWPRPRHLRWRKPVVAVATTAGILIGTSSIAAATGWPAPAARVVDQGDRFWRGPQRKHQSGHGYRHQRKRGSGDGYRRRPWQGSRPWNDHRHSTSKDQSRYRDQPGRPGHRLGQRCTAERQSRGQPGRQPGHRLGQRPTAERQSRDQPGRHSGHRIGQRPTAERQSRHQPGRKSGHRPTAERQSRHQPGRQSGHRLGQRPTAERRPWQQAPSQVWPGAAAPRFSRVRDTGGQHTDRSIAMSIPSSLGSGR
jgi:hypothetical protein